VAAARCLRHVQCEVTHPLEALGGVDGGEHGAQIGGDGGLQRQQRVRVLLTGRPGVVDLRVVADHLFGEAEIGLQQRLGGELHRRGGHGAHVGQLFRELTEFDMVGLTHGDSLRARSDGNDLPG
jgi:hypothetical protein